MYSIRLWDLHARFCQNLACNTGLLTTLDRPGFAGGSNFRESGAAMSVPLWGIVCVGSSGEAAQLGRAQAHRWQSGEADDGIGWFGTAAILGSG